MFDDLLELATTAVHPDHSPHISHPITSNDASSSTMPPRRRREKSQSASSASGDVNDMPPPAVPASASASPPPVATRHKRTKSTNSQLASALATRPHQAKEEAAPLRFLVAAVASLSLSALLRFAMGNYTTLGNGALSAFSKNPEDNTYAPALLGWRILVLAIYWFGGYDAYDVASLTTLVSTPVALLQYLFYTIKPEVMAIDVAIGIVSSAVPFYLLRSIAPAHHPRDKSTKGALRNRAILTDPYTTAFTSILATAILAVLLEFSFETFLPTFLIREFTYISTLEPAHRGAAQLPILLLALLPAGLACRFFLFAPSTSVPIAEVAELDTQTAGFVEHLKWNMWGWYSSRQKVLLTRTAVLGILTLTEVLTQCCAALEGISLVGGAGYGGLWVFGYVVVMQVLDWVSKPSDY